MNKIYIEVAFDNIYNFAVGIVKCHGSEPFALTFDTKYQIVSIESGELASGNILSSTNDKGRNILQFSCIGLVTQRKFRHTATDTDLDSYGMQYFPYISSIIQIKCKTITATIESISVTLPESYRVLWFRQNVSRNGISARIAHSQGEKNSLYVFNWPATKDSLTSDLLAKLPVRLGGREYLSIVSFPLWYYTISLIVVTLLSFQDKSNITFSGVGAIWVLMLRNFSKANAPQMNTVLKDMYVLLGIFLLVWALFWEFAGFYALILLLPIIFCVLFYTNASKEFNKEGILPEQIESYFFKRRYRNEQKNRANHRLHSDRNSRGV